MGIFEAVRPLEPGRPVDVLERDEAGALVGAWHGYWSFKRGTVALYPNPRNKYVNWPKGRIPSGRIVVSDRQIRIKVQSAEVKVQNKETPVTICDRSNRKLPIEGQEEIKL